MECSPVCIAWILIQDNEVNRNYMLYDKAAWIVSGQRIKDNVWWSKLVLVYAGVGLRSDDEHIN
jgi:hypothetical protein